MAKKHGHREREILAWVDKVRPDIREHILRIFDNSSAGEMCQAQYFLLTIGFEAGRKFSAENPTITPDIVLGE